MNRIKYLLGGVLLAVALNTPSAVFNIFQPATGVLVGNANTYVTTAATSANITPLVATSQSVANSGTTITLSGDSATPGNSMLYGTNSSGTKGWYSQPSSGITLVTGTFTGTLTGLTTSPTVTVNYSCIANHECVLQFSGAVNGTSNSAAFTMTGLPSAAQPATATFVYVQAPSCEDNGNDDILCGASVAAGSGTITFYRGALATNATGASINMNGAWTTSGTKGFNSLTLVYANN